MPELMRSGDNRQLFMFVRRDDGIYILYTMDALDFYRRSIPNDSLLPLIVFQPGVLPDCECSFAYIEPYFYVVGQNKHHVFTLKKDRLLKLVPSENYRGGKYVNPVCNPMFRDKFCPLAFAYDNKLYVLSKTPHYSSASGNLLDFEVYSPSNGLWTDLARKPPKQLPHVIYFLSHLVLGTKVYFTTSIQVVVSFDLKAQTWSTIFDPNGVLTFPIQYIYPRPLFEAQIQVIGNRIFGIFTLQGPSGHSDICASSSWKPHEDFFLRPNLAPDKQFFHDVFGGPTELNRDISAWRTYMFTLDEGARIMGVVCYCRDLLSHRDELTNFASLSIFKIADEPSPSPTVVNNVPLAHWDTRRFSYAREQDHVNYFKAELLHSTYLFINTQKEFTYGTPYSCIFV